MIPVKSSVNNSSFLYSNLSLASEDADSPESMLSGTSGSFSDVSALRLFDNRHSPDKPLLTKRGHLQELHSRGAQSSPASLTGSLTDIPVLLVNGEPEPQLHNHSPEPDVDLTHTVTVSHSKPFSPHSELRVSHKSDLLAATTC